MGVFWHNAAETWIDITNAAANKVLYVVNKLKTCAPKVKKLHSFWIQLSWLSERFFS